MLDLWCDGVFMLPCEVAVPAQETGLRGLLRAVSVLVPDPGSTEAFWVISSP